MKYFLLIMLSCSVAFAGPKGKTKQKPKSSVKKWRMSQEQLEQLELMIKKVDYHINTITPACPDYSRTWNMECV